MNEKKLLGIPKIEGPGSEVFMTPDQIKKMILAFGNNELTPEALKDIGNERSWIPKLDTSDKERSNEFCQNPIKYLIAYSDDTKEDFMGPEAEGGVYYSSEHLEHILNELLIQINRAKASSGENLAEEIKNLVVKEGEPLIVSAPEFVLKIVKKDLGFTLEDVKNYIEILMTAASPIKKMQLNTAMVKMKEVYETD